MNMKRADWLIAGPVIAFLIVLVAATTISFAINERRYDDMDAD